MSSMDMTEFQTRLTLTQKFIHQLRPFLEKHEILVLPLGQDQLLVNEPRIIMKLKEIKFKKSSAALVMKYCPDLLCAYPKSQNPDHFFFLDAKTSITPVYYQRHIDRIKQHAGLEQLHREDVGLIEREAWFVYNRFYHKVAIVFATPYNPNLILADWISNIECLWCYKKIGSIPWNCEECPVYGKGVFGVVRNFLADGSKTPQTNIHLGEMRNLREFLLDEFNIRINETEYQKLLNMVKKWELFCPSRVNPEHFQRVKESLSRICKWLC